MILVGTVFDVWSQLKRYPGITKNVVYLIDTPLCATVHRGLEASFDKVEACIISTTEEVFDDRVIVSPIRTEARSSKGSVFLDKAVADVHEELLGANLPVFATVQQNREYTRAHFAWQAVD